MRDSFTGKVVEEGNLDGAAYDGVDPKPPAGAENSAGETRPENRPKFS